MTRHWVCVCGGGGGGGGEEKRGYAAEVQGLWPGRLVFSAESFCWPDISLAEHTQCLHTVMIALHECSGKHSSTDACTYVSYEYHIFVETDTYGKQLSKLILSHWDRTCPIVTLNMPLKAIWWSLWWVADMRPGLVYILLYKHATLRVCSIPPSENGSGWFK